MKVLTIDVGGTNVKILATGQRVRRKFPSGPTLTPSQMVSTVKKLACPVKLMNDAAMQALGSYKGGTMLFLGLGTGLGAALVVDHIVVPMEWGHFSYKNGTVEDYVGARGLRRLGTKKWRSHVMYGLSRMLEVFCVDDIVVGGGNAKKLKDLPTGCRHGDNANAFLGGFRMWQESSDRQRSLHATRTVEIAAGRRRTVRE